MRRHKNLLSVRLPSLGLTFASVAILGALILSGCAGEEAEGPEVPKVGPLVVPSRIEVVSDDGQLSISWGRIPNAVSYTLYWSTSPNPTMAKATKIPGLGKTSYKLSGLTDGHEVYFLLTASNPSGDSKPAAFRAKPLKVTYIKFDKQIAAIVQPTDTFASLAKLYLKDPSKGWMISDYNDLDSLTPYQAVTIPLQEWKVGGLSAGELQSVPLLTYHRFSADGTANRMIVPKEKFEAQMQFLKDNDYRVVSLDDFANFIEFKKQLPERAVVITADDGWMSFYQYAYPILRKYGYPSTLFVYTDFPESDKLALTWAQIKEMSKHGVDIECHSKTHRNLRMGPNEQFKAYVAQLEEELKVSQADMKRKGGITCRYLAYPYGGRNPLVVALTQKYGFRAAFTVTRGSDSFLTQDFLIRRSMIYGEYGLKEFENNLKVTAELK